MDMGTFLSETEWLREPQVGQDLSVARQWLGTRLGSDDWYTQDATLEQLLTFLNSDPVLLAGLASAESDPAGWVYSVAAAYRYSEPVMDENYGMAYRYDKLDGVYEWEHPENPGTWLCQEEADQLMTEWAQGDAQGAADAASESAAEWDENWAMFYKFTADGAYYYAHARQPGVPESGCSEAWLTYEQASLTYDEVFRGSGASGAEPAAPAGADAEHAQIAWLEALWDNRLQQVIEKVRTAGAGPEQITDEQIAVMLSEAVSRAMQA